jgi:hypothetical protein
LSVAAKVIFTMARLLFALALCVVAASAFVSPVNNAGKFAFGPAFGSDVLEDA